MIAGRPIGVEVPRMISQFLGAQRAVAVLRDPKVIDDGPPTESGGRLGCRIVPPVAHRYRYIVINLSLDLCLGHTLGEGCKLSEDPCQ